MPYRVAFDAPEEFREHLTGLPFGTLRPLMTHMTNLGIQLVDEYGIFRTLELLETGALCFTVEDDHK